ncbi:DNA replication protein [Burkholderia sp. MSMB1459WGS]|uniref:PriCT-2 domain-containing protein n=1 Tax=Burkholderia sp. MSMB1459WGS TaxID=1637970 RepID=UPI00075F7763|nr:PriCT-2 domain-containing protein [Burkholderia sp. MSMB1459WGS]KWO47955.1 DNA replication protein [Burkholderia sp. MSMB1459WGS]
MSGPFVSEAERVRAALSTIPAEDYTTWVDMAFAVKHGLGDAGFDLWDAWSQTAPNYDARAARATWRSASEKGGKTLASLFWLASQHGFDLAGSRVFGNRAGSTATSPAPMVDGGSERERKSQARRAAVAREAQAIWRWARPLAPDHPYMVRKQIPLVPTLRELEAEELHALLGYVPKRANEPLRGRVLIVPVSIGNRISTLELIDRDGRKSALAGGAKAGGCWEVAPMQSCGEVCMPIMIAEGVATAVSAWQATHWYTLAALSSGNLLKVALAWRARYPQAELVILADLGAGYAHAEHAARDAQARLVAPQFTPGSRVDNQVPTDFNDMAVLSGVDAVGELLRSAVRDGPLLTPLDEGRGHMVANSMSFNVAGVQDMARARADKGTGANEVSLRPVSQGSSKEVAPMRTPEDGQPARSSVQSSSPPSESVADQGAAQASRRAPGALLYGLDAVPEEIKTLAQHRFGATLRMATPREHGGPYRGEVFNTEHYLVQEVAPRSVVFHAKAEMTFVSDRLRWMDENHRLNGADVQVGYDGAQAKVYPWDRARDQLERAVASLKKSAREIGMGEDLDAKLDALQAASWERVKAARATALARAKACVEDRGDTDDPPR